MPPPRPQPRFVFVGGKGGVGKTTSAAAHAVAEARSGARVLIASSDPAHSLGDALDVKLSGAPRLVTRQLFAVELDAPRAFARWLREHRGPLGDVIEHGTWLDRSDIDTLLDLSLPGVDELVGLLEIVRLSSRYDLVVVDTAPTGHTLRLLASPETVATVAGVLDALEAEHRIIRQQLARVRQPDAADRLIALIAQQASDAAAIVRDARRTAFHWVTLPERLALLESADALSSLTASGVRVDEVVVNRVLPDGPRCPICDRRRLEERRVLTEIRRSLGKGRRLRIVPELASEPRGVRALARLHASRSSFDPSAGSGSSRATARDDKLRMSEKEAASAANASKRTSAQAKNSLALSSSSFDKAQDDSERVEGSKGEHTPLETLPAIRGAELLFIAGKGGVGKTTVAAAIALRLARSMPRASVLLLSTDPAHSLADVLDAPVGDRAARIAGAPPNLEVRELNAAAALEEKRAALAAALDEIAGAAGAAANTAHEGASHLMELAPPGVDEVFGMMSVVEATRSHRLVVVDSAPTGHALRLLETPVAIRDWIQVLLRVLLKYKAVMRPGRFAAELVDASRSIRALQELLHSSRRTRCLAVTRAAAVPRAETERLVRKLRALKLAVPALIVNARTLAAGTCPRCRRTAAAEAREVARLRPLARRRECVIIHTPLAAPPPRGPEALERWARSWRASGR